MFGLHNGSLTPSMHHHRNTMTMTMTMTNGLLALDNRPITIYSEKTNKYMLCIGA